MHAESCACFEESRRNLSGGRFVGMDRNYAEVSVVVCGSCGQHWLRYFYEQEAFTGSGRWYLGAVTPEQATAATADGAKSLLENLDWYFYGGSYYGGRTGRSSGEIILTP